MSSSFRWLLLAGLLLTAAALPAQPPAKAAPKAPPPEVEDPNTKPVKPPPQIEDAPKAGPVVDAEGPGITPPAGVLVVGVRSLPEFMSPQFARTDSEKYALDLIFEGLLRPGADGAGGRVYEPALARELPALVPLGRAFTLTDAAWGDPDRPNAAVPVVAGDVVSTVEKLRKRQGQPGADVADWIEPVTTDAVKRCQITLTRGHIDPLSLMTFKILPAKQKDDVTFARNPIGSGPFVYKGRETKGRREYAVFEANPAYRRPNPPRLHAVWMVLSRNPVNDFRSGLVHFVLTDHTDELAVLKPAAAKPMPAATEGQQAGRLEINIENKGRVDTLFGRRVYFLAVNHQSPKLGDGKNGRDLRRFLAYAIQRETILTTVFRAGFEKHHQALTGPFPPDTWPCSPNAPLRLDDADAVNRGKDAAAVELELKYPGGDPAVAQACKLMAEQVAGLKAGVTLKLKAVDPADYYQQIVYDTDFQLAYWYYDYPDDWFSPAGLFDPAARGHGGRNFMGYVPKDLLQPLARCRDRREFSVVRQAMQQVHSTFATEMPFIPLWHLDTHALFAAGLTTVPSAAQLDPLAPFTHIEQWTVK